ncbi:MAG: 23S rRNA (pseudouridine(1915)-N(3))-methyltransferase RlmH, partial [Candidatus Cloacimonadaceae bacterium]|nr:23S rRNA (pseudouridine(1915)-N(3))-methyltransferase RlmH [Candidatus Cloacimonadaceae bacterium]
LLLTLALLLAGALNAEFRVLENTGDRLLIEYRLDETGAHKSSLEFSRYLTSLSERKSVVFVIGGVFGTDNALKQRADMILSLSAMTFTHQMVRLILIEQIYRAFMISHNRNYHI